MNDEKMKLKERIKELEEEIESRFYHADEEMEEVEDIYQPELSLSEHMLYQRIEYLDIQVEGLLQENRELKEGVGIGGLKIELSNTTKFIDQGVFKRLQDSLRHANNNTEYLK